MSTHVTQNSFTRGVEVWRPNTDDTLEWQAGSYQDLPNLEACSRGLTFARGEGLPGMSWSHAAPMILHNLYSGQFVRSEAAAAAGLDCGVALPFFRGRELRGVVVLLMETTEDLRGAVEIWRPNDRRELGLSESYYANLDRFARLSQFVKFPCGAGLPGQIWQTRCPKVIGDLGNAPNFVRGNGARADRLTFGLGLPFMKSPWELESVTLLLSSADSPIARHVEVWIRDDDEQLVLHSDSSSDEIDTTRRLARGEGAAGRVWEEEAPQIFTADNLAAVDEGETVVGFPVFVGETLVAVVTLYI